MVFDLTEHSSSRSSSHQLLPPVSSVLVMLASVQLIPVHLIKLPPVMSLFWAVQLSMRQPCSIPVLLQSVAKLPSTLGRWEFNEILYNYGDTYIQHFVFLMLETENHQTGSVLCYVERQSDLSGRWLFSMLQWEAQRPWWTILECYCIEWSKWIRTASEIPLSCSSARLEKAFKVHTSSYS